MARQGRADAPGILFFVLADVGSFLLIIAIFMAQRLGDAAAFGRQSSSLDVRIGTINTLVLLTSGWLVALAIGAMRDGRFASARRRLNPAIILGCCFILLKAYEYFIRFEEGTGLDGFFAFYVILTGLHLIHVVAGVCVLVLMRRATSPDLCGAERLAWSESGALYWHMVDLIWVFLFPVLYLQPTSL